MYKAKPKNEPTPSRKKTQLFSYNIIFLLSSTEVYGTKTNNPGYNLLRSDHPSNREEWSVVCSCSYRSPSQTAVNLRFTLKI